MNRFILRGDHAGDVCGHPVDLDDEREALYARQVDRAYANRQRVLKPGWISPFLVPPSVRSATS
jgi:hypothetical protein